MRIVLATHSFPPEATGVAGVAFAHATHLSDRGHSVTVLTSVGSGGELSGSYQFDVVRFACYGNWLTGMKGEVERYRHWIRECNADLLVIHCAQTWCLDALLTDPPFPASRTVLASHGLSQFANPEFGGYFQRVAEFLGGQGAITSLSRILEETAFCERFRLPPPVVIPNGVNLSEWATPTLNMRHEWGIQSAPWIVSVSNHSPVKDHDFLWRVTARLQHARPDLAATIVGSSYGAAKFDLGRFGIKGGCWYACCVRSFFSNAVSLRSGVPRAKVVSAIKEASVVVVTSRREAQPLVLMEAMAAGVPWVSRNVGAVSELPGGIMVEGEQEFYQAVDSLLASVELRSALGHEGRRFAESELSWSSVVDKHIALYERQIKRPI